MNSNKDLAAPERSTAQRVAILALAILQIVATLLPGLGLGEPIGDRSNVARTAITPAGWAFSIWGPLFTGSVLYALYQFAPRQRDSALLARIGWASAGAFLGNAIWALYTQFLGLSAGSALIIIFTLCCLLLVYRAFAEAREPFTRGEQFLVVLPLSALAAWLSAATIVNVAASLKFHGVDAGSATPLVAGGIVMVGGLIATVALWKGRANPWYAPVFLWALAGIYSRGAEAEVDIATMVAAAMVILALAIGLGRKSWRDRWFAATPKSTSQ